MVKVSVCIPTYNRSHYLQYAINSVLNQSFDDYELIICDDASSDNTAEIVNQYQDSRIRYIKHPQNIGRSKNMRSGFAAATGEYFIKFDDDDAIAPEFLAKTVKILDSSPEADFVCTDHWIINASSIRDEAATRENSAKWGKDKLQSGIIPNLIEETFIKQSLQVGSTLFRRRCLAAIDYMRPEADGCEDFDLLVRIALAGYQGYFLPELLMEYRFHGGQTSLKQDIHFLSAKAFCIDSYHFSQPELEALRVNKLASTQQGLGIRLIEKGESTRGRELLQQSSQVLGKSYRVYFGIFLSYLPTSFRKTLLNILRNLKPQDYSAKVRNFQ
ncbi:MAG: glycosyltransferase family 2 protein [Xenococcaceae cyanobacterium MO_167.B52]|nr:glycosyltransferase family 2 protein [Xenococcaceae cyanobacterium MO_167.B52]